MERNFLLVSIHFSSSGFFSKEVSNIYDLTFNITSLPASNIEASTIGSHDTDVKEGYMEGGRYNNTDRA